jgi:hypothetical protein
VTSIPALDVAIGFSVAFFLLSTVVSAAREAVASVFNVRAKSLEAWLRSVLEAKPGTDGAPTGSTAVSQFYGSAVVRALSLGSGRGSSDRLPSYIPSPRFVEGVLSVGRKGAADVENAKDLFDRVGLELNGLPNCEAKHALLEIYGRAEGNVARFHAEAQSWFDDCMERLSGWYRRSTQRFVWIGSAVLIVAINVDSLQIAKSLWTDPGARAAVAASAGNPSGLSADRAITQLDSLPLPVGWGHMHWHWSTFPNLWHLGGWLLSLCAVSLGAPFWFDTLSRFARIRSGGPPPPVTGATRRGEGDQAREGPPAAGSLPTNPQ